MLQEKKNEKGNENGAVHASPTVSDNTAVTLSSLPPYIYEGRIYIYIQHTHERTNLSLNTKRATISSQPKSQKIKYTLYTQVTNGSSYHCKPLERHDDPCSLDCRNKPVFPPETSSKPSVRAEYSCVIYCVPGGKGWGRFARRRLKYLGAFPWDGKGNGPVCLLREGNGTGRLEAIWLTGWDRNRAPPEIT